MKVLIIDDSKAMRRIIRRTIENYEFNDILEAENGRIALDTLLSDNQIELCLVDWNMPVMNGLEFIETVRADPTYKDVKLVMVTTETEPERMARALMMGVDEFVMKPFTDEILVEKLKLIGVDLQPAA